MGYVLGKFQVFMSAIQELKKTVARLRGPGGCPWDIEQTHQSICDCLAEEVAELLETIDRGDMAHMREELGDLLLHVVMHAQMAAEEGHFDLEAVAAEVNQKLIRRHPHVFGDLTLGDAASVVKKWDEIKATEKKNGLQRAGIFKHLPPQLSAILYAREVYKQIDKQRLPLDGEFQPAAIAAKSDGLDEVAAGQQLFEWVAACRKAGIDPESALRRFTHRVIDTIEQRAANTS